MTRTTSTPTTKDVHRIAESFADESIVSLHRYETGMCHWVYRCETAGGQTFVLRVARPQNSAYIRGGITITTHLTDAGVPVARLLGGDPDGHESGYPWMAVEHLPGRDLRYVYEDLSSRQKSRLASQIADIQRRVAHCVESTDFGYVHSPDDTAAHSTFDGVVDELIERSKTWLSDTTLDASEEVELVEQRIEQFRPVLTELSPTAFLEDLTTKNVLVYQGRLTGIVDVDELCFGDPMIWVGLTRMSLLNIGHNADYIDYLLDELDARPEDRQRCDFYTGLFAFVFLSEQGINFNQRRDDSLDHERVQTLRKLLRQWL